MPASQMIQTLAAGYRVGAIALNRLTYAKGR